MLLSACSPGSGVSDGSALNVVSGRVIRIDSLPSAYVTARPIDIWIPEGVVDYGAAGDTADSTTQRPPRVLYMADGQMLFDGDITWNGAEWKVDEMISRMIREGRIEPLIVVGVHNNGEFRRSEYFPEAILTHLDARDRVRIETTQLKGEALGDEYLSYLVEEVKPYVDRRFRPAQGPENTLVMGASMGGVISLYAALQRPDVFGRVGAMSTHWPLLDQAGRESTEHRALMEAFLTYLMQSVPRAATGTHAFYFDRGSTEDSLYAPMQIAMDRIMVEKGYYRKNWRSMIFPDAKHHEDDWSARFDIPLEFLLTSDPAGAAETMRRAEEKLRPNRGKSTTE